MAIRLGVIAWVGAAAVCTACGSSHSAPTKAPGPSSAPSVRVSTPAEIQGALDIVTQLGEQCPQVPTTPDPRCDPVPRPGTSFEVRTASGAVEATGKSGADGHATVYVRPGEYVVRGEPVTGYQFTPERHVEVTEGATIAVPLTYTNGIQ